MKKIFALLLIMCFVLVGCGKKEEKMITGGWEIISNNNVSLSEEELHIFNSVKDSYKDANLKGIAVVGKQVVAGTNYMYLAEARKNDEVTYKFVVIYNDLEGNSSLTKVTDFDYVKYVKENVEGNSAVLAGGWYSEDTNLNILDEKTKSVFDKATSTLTGMTYTPIATLGKQIVAGTNYAILCFGTPSVNPSEMVTNVYVVTLYEDLNENSEFESSAFVSLEQFN